MQSHHMSIIDQLLQTLPDFVTIALLSLLILLLLFTIVRLLHLSPRWILPGIGVILLLFSLSRVLPDFLDQPNQFPQNMAAIGSMTGLIAVVGAFYAFGQYIARGWYLLVKKRLCSRGANASRNMLRFLRTIHQFIGWSVLVISSVHALVYIPWLLAPPRAMPLSSTALLTGIIAWGILALLIGLGLWIEWAIRHKHLATKTRLIHIITAGTFFVVVLVHIGLR